MGKTDNRPTKNLTTDRPTNNRSILTLRTGSVTSKPDQHQLDILFFHKCDSMCSFFQENYKCAKLKYAKNFAQFFRAKFSFKFSHFSQNCEKLRKRSEFASLRFAENNLTFASLSLRNFFRKKIRIRFAFAIDFLPEFGSLD